LIRRHFFFALGIVAPSMSVAQPAIQAEALESASTLEQLVAVLQARDAQSSTHLLLDLPDVAAPGPVRASMRSELPGTSAFVLARGAFKATANVAGNLGPPPILAARKIGSEIKPPDPTMPRAWISSASIKAGEPARAQARFSIEKTEVFTLFAHAQGRWWFVTREVKVGQVRGRR
jgi:hypothetical protein